MGNRVLEHEKSTGVTFQNTITRVLTEFADISKKY